MLVAIRRKRGRVVVVVVAVVVVIPILGRVGSGNLVEFIVIGVCVCLAFVPDGRPGSKLPILGARRLAGRRKADVPFEFALFCLFHRKAGHVVFLVIHQLVGVAAAHEPEAGVEDYLLAVVVGIVGVEPVCLIQPLVVGVEVVEIVVVQYYLGFVLLEALDGIRAHNLYWLFYKDSYRRPQAVLSGAGGVDDVYWGLRSGLGVGWSLPPHAVGRLGGVDFVLCPNIVVNLNAFAPQFVGE